MSIFWVHKETIVDRPKKLEQLMNEAITMSKKWDILKEYPLQI